MDENEISKKIGEEILLNVEIAKQISVFDTGVEKGMDIVCGFVKRVCGINEEE